MTEKKSSRAKRGAEIAEQKTTAGRSWAPTPEAKSKALTSRLVAAVLWAVAIGLESFTIFWVLKQDAILIWLIVVMVVVIGGFALGGSLLWKKANRLDPASREDTVRFFVQNQLGVIITVVAFLPLIVMIFLNKDMDGKQKGIAGGVAIVIAAAVGLASADWNPPSVEQYSVETNVVKELTGEDEVVWVKGGSAFHVCEDVPDLRRSTKTKEHGTVAQAHEANIPRLTKKWTSEAINNCGYTPEQVDAVLGEVDDVTSTLDEGQYVETSGTPEVVAPK
ncbi:hypothetical protein [Gordonia humi]|uniref:Uncharacterized protein n=1 Tax=Gordonia humi TaxID=686429 RepID=A0A840F3F5_9ACTN|nr:hypothetical protein [Gordonia humi]MBB4136998.1 hypothetical protein [Gordonia humi]